MWDTLVEFDKGWITAIIEGEGYIAARKTQRGATEFIIQVTSTDEEVVVKLGKLCGGKIYGPYQGKKAHHKPTYSWRLYRTAEARSLIEGMYPHFSQHRKDQVEKAIQTYDGRNKLRGALSHKERRPSVA